VRDISVSIFILDSYTIPGARMFLVLCIVL
jgi:hypothetical protein